MHCSVVSCIVRNIETWMNKAVSIEWESSKASKRGALQIGKPLHTGKQRAPGAAPLPHPPTYLPTVHSAPHTHTRAKDRPLSGFGCEVLKPTPNTKQTGMQEAPWMNVKNSFYFSVNNIQKHWTYIAKRTTTKIRCNKWKQSSHTRRTQVEWGGGGSKQRRCACATRYMLRHVPYSGKTALSNSWQGRLHEQQTYVSLIYLNAHLPPHSPHLRSIRYLKEYGWAAARSCCALVTRAFMGPPAVQEHTHTHTVRHHRYAKARHKKWVRLRQRSTVSPHNQFLSPRCAQMPPPSSFSEHHLSPSKVFSERTNKQNGCANNQMYMHLNVYKKSR